MQCSKCNSELPPQQRFCPQCGTFSKGPQPRLRSLGARRPAMLISMCLLVFLAAAGSAAYGVYLIRQNKPTAAPQSSASQPQAPQHRSAEPEPASAEHVVDHGGVVQPGELQGHGTLYFVPMGRQVIPAQSLADYYEQKFQIKITVLPAVEVESSSCVPARHQCS